MSLFQKYTIELEKTESAMHCNLKAAEGLASRSGLFSAKFLLRMRRNYYNPASGQILISLLDSVTQMT